MTTALSDPRTEQVQRSADNLCHIVCDECFPVVSDADMSLCGESLAGTDLCEAEKCRCPKCSMCVMAFRPHVEKFHPDQAHLYDYNYWD